MSISQISRSIGSSRTLTSDFKKFRAEIKKSQPLEFGSSKREITFQGVNHSHVNLQENKTDQLPPEWVDTYEKITDDLTRLEEKCNKLHSDQAQRSSGRKNEYRIRRYIEKRQGNRDPNSANHQGDY